MLNWVVFGVELWEGAACGVFEVELRGVELSGVWNWEGFGVEPRAEKEWPFCVELMCWTEEGVELRGPVF